MRIVPKRIRLTLLLTVGIVASGCTTDIRSYCEELVECNNGNENDEDACVAYFKASRKIADAYDCKDAFNDLMNCEAENGECLSVALPFEPSRGSVRKMVFFSKDDTCSKAVSSYNSCMPEAEGLIQFLVGMFRD